MHVLVAWDWYIKRVTTIETPGDGVRYSARFPNGQWAREPHVWQTLHTLYDERSLVFVGDDSVVQKVAHNMIVLAWHIVSHRAWSLSIHVVPPERFAIVASSDPTISQHAVNSMKQGWQLLM